MANYFLGIKANGLRELNKQLLKPKFRGKKIDDTIDKIENELKECDVISFLDSPSVYVGKFFYSEKQKVESLLKQSKEYKQCLKLVTDDFDKISIDKTNMIIELSTEMK